jgi:hypothetical protein
MFRGWGNLRKVLGKVFSIHLFKLLQQKQVYEMLNRDTKKLNGASQEKLDRA